MQARPVPSTGERIDRGRAAALGGGGPGDAVPADSRPPLRALRASPGPDSAPPADPTTPRPGTPAARDARRRRPRRGVRRGIRARRARPGRPGAGATGRPVVGSGGGRTAGASGRREWIRSYIRRRRSEGTAGARLRSMGPSRLTEVDGRVAYRTGTDRVAYRVAYRTYGEVTVREERAWAATGSPRDAGAQRDRVDGRTDGRPRAGTSARSGCPERDRTARAGARRTPAAGVRAPRGESPAVLTALGCPRPPPAAAGPLPWLAGSLLRSLRSRFFRS